MEILGLECSFYAKSRESLRMRLVLRLNAMWKIDWKLRKLRGVHQRVGNLCFIKTAFWEWLLCFMWASVHSNLLNFFFCRIRRTLSSFAHMWRQSIVLPKKPLKVNLALTISSRTLLHQDNKPSPETSSVFFFNHIMLNMTLFVRDLKQQFFSLRRPIIQCNGDVHKTNKRCVYWVSYAKCSN